MDLLTAPNYYAQLRKTDSTETKKPLSESTVEGVHATLCSILSDVVEGGFLTHNPAWHTYRYAGRQLERKVAPTQAFWNVPIAILRWSAKRTPPRPCSPPCTQAMAHSSRCKWRWENRKAAVPAAQ